MYGKADSLLMRIVGGERWPKRAVKKSVEAAEGVAKGC
jgi:hypothetical protein